MGRKIINLIGHRFGRLAIVAFNHKCKDKHSFWLTRCDCGTEKVISSAHLRAGGTISCGCWKKERIFKHGMARTSTYQKWKSMKQRCLNSKNKDYKNYGGRGITICDRWLNSFENFYQDMGDPGKGLSIDRIDNDGNYELSNCRWSDRNIQNNNARSNVKITYKGKTQTIVQWAKELNINLGALRTRFYREWSIERALTEKSC